MRTKDLLDFVRSCMVTGQQPLASNGAHGLPAQLCATLMPFLAPVESQLAAALERGEDVVSGITLSTRVVTRDLEAALAAQESARLSAIPPAPGEITEGTPDRG